MSQPPLGIQFKDEDIRQLEYGSTSDNPLLKVIQASRRDSVVEHAKKWD